MRATSEVLDDNKVKLAVAIDEDEVEAAVAAAAKSIARDVRIPGFRPGRAPRQVVEARIGGSRALRDEAMRDLVPDFYARAISATEVEPIGSPEVTVTSGEDDGPVEFDAVVEIRPVVAVSGYDAMRVTIPSPFATDEEVDRLVDRLRETDSELAEVSRPIVTGDFVTCDVEGRSLTNEEEIISIPDYVYLVGQGSLVDTVDDQLPGMRVGEVLEVDGTAPGGGQMSYKLTLKQVRERVLPELTDEWVAENSEFSTVDELRDSYLDRIRTAKLDQARSLMRDSVMSDLAAQVADDDVPASMVDDETRQRLRELQDRLEANKLTFESYFKATGQDPDNLLEMLRMDATRAVKIDLVLRSIAAEVGIEVTPAQLDEEIATLATQVKMKPDVLRNQLERSGRLGAVRAERVKQLTTDWVLERVTYVDPVGAEIDRAVLDAPSEDDEAADDAHAPTDDTTEEHQ